MYSLSAGFEAKVAAAADDGLSIIYCVYILYPTLGWKHYATRAITLSGWAHAAKLMGPPAIDKQAHFGAAQGALPMNSALTVDLINTPETEYGETDTARIQDYVAQYGILGAIVKVGVVEASGTTFGDFKCDGIYRVDGYSHSANVVRLSLVDAMLHPGEAEVTVKLGAHFPLAPDSSKGQTVGPVFGKCDGIELIPVVGGNTVSLYAAITETDTSAILQGVDWRNLSATGILYIENERCVYTRISGGTGSTQAVVSLGRNDGHLDSVLAGHAAGCSVHLCAMSSGAPLYRFAVGIADAFTCTNYRAVLKDGTPVFISSPSASGSVDIAGRKLWYLDWTSRIKAENYSTSKSSFERGFAEEVLTRGADGYATPTGFKYWSAGSGCSSSLVAQIPLALDPKASTQALYLKANSATSKTLHLLFNLGLITNDLISAFTHKYGRFAGARLNLRLQYSKVDAYRPSWRVEREGALLPFDGASGTIEGPPDAVSIGAGDIAISGEAPIAKENWEQTTTETEIKLGVSARGYIGPAWTYATMVDPNEAAIASGTTQSAIPVGNLTDGNKQTGVGAVDWAAGYDPLELVSTSTASPPAGVTNTYCRLYTVNRLFESAAARDKLTSLRLYAYHVHNADGLCIAEWRTGFEFIVTAWSGENLSGTKLWTSPTWSVGSNESSKYYNVPLAAFATTKPQSLSIDVRMFSSPVWDGTYYNWYGRIVGGFNLYMSVQKYIEGAQDDVMVDSGYFEITGAGSGGDVPSAIYDYSIPLTDLVNKWAAQQGTNPWAFFSGSNGLGFKLSIASAVGTLQVAVGDIELELEYNAYAPEWDAPLLADLDGQTGALISGGTGVLETPMDLLLYLVDSAHYAYLPQYSDETEFAAVHAYTSQYKLARAVREETTLQELIGSLCAECGCVLLFDGESIYPKRITPSFALASSVMEIGTQDDDALGLVSDDVMLEQPLDSYACRVSFGYRKSNFFSGAEGGIVQSAVSPIHSIFARRAMEHKTLEWHSSWRGYGSRAAQDAIVAAYAQQQLALVSTPWEYIDVTLYLAAGEKLQRGDIVTFSYPRLGPIDVPARVVSTTRIAFDQWRVRLQLYPGTSAYYWLYSTNYWLRYRASNSELEIVVAGVPAAVIDANGNIRCLGDTILDVAQSIGRFGEEGTPQHNSITADPARTRILFWLYREEEEDYELVMSVSASGNVRLYGDAPTSALRDWLTYGTYSETDAGVHDTGDGESTTGQLRFSTGATVKCYIGSSINAEPYANSIGDLTAGDV